MSAPNWPWIPLAGRALSHSAADRMDVAVRCVQRIASEHGPDALPRVMLSWIDTAWMRLFPDGLPAGYLDRPMRFWHVGEASTASVDDVPPALRWAGRFVFARLADDEQQARALLAAVQTDREWSAVVQAVLDVCGANLRLAPAAEGSVSVLPEETPGGTP